MSETILKVEDLTVAFHTKYGHAEAVRGISFELKRGEKLGIVGESGSGKSVTSKAILRLLSPETTGVSGRIWLEETDLLGLPEKEMEKIRGNRISMVFQEPMVSLNPLYTIGDQMREVLLCHHKIKKKEAQERVLEMLRLVEIPSPETRLKQYPFELSGGLQQRVMIAMALLCDPEVLIADEPTTALDVTIQAQILDLLNKVNRELGTSIILITHDMGVIAEMADTVAVMYAGCLVEKAPVEAFFESPCHPYAKGLLHSVPGLEPEAEELRTMEGRVPGIYEIPGGCAFHDRCPYAKEICQVKRPELTGSVEHKTACFLYEKERRKEENGGRENRFGSDSGGKAAV